ncbi:MAG: hypothetical protein RXP91_05425 [Nitrososphaeria archaeon]
MRCLRESLEISKTTTPRTIPPRTRRQSSWNPALWSSAPLSTSSSL